MRAAPMIKKSAHDNFPNCRGGKRRKDYTLNGRDPKRDSELMTNREGNQTNR